MRPHRHETIIDSMRFKHTDRPGFWFGLIDFCTSEELKAKAIGMGIEGPYTSWWHMFGWNTFGVFLLGPAIATKRFFDTLNKIERKMNDGPFDL